MTEELNTIETVDTSPFKKMVMTIGELPTSFVDSMTYYELLAWLCNYLQNTVIPAVNNNAEVSEELQTQFLELKDYVDDYFDNLDVQEEIDNKLDEMAEDGSLTAIIKAYVDPIYQAFETEITDEITLQQTKIDDIDSKVDSLASGSPLVASSTADMTETDRVYVNTTDGKWYYYDGEEWQIGGTYQSTGIDPNDPVIKGITDKVDDCIKYYDNLFDKTAIVLDKSPKSTTINDLADTPGVNCSGIMEAKPATTYTCTSHISGNNNVFFYRTNGDYAYRKPFTEQADGSWQLTTEAAGNPVAFMRFQYAPAYVNLNTFMLVEGSELPATYEPHGGYIDPEYLRTQDANISSNTTRISTLEAEVADYNNVINIFHKGVCIGDSITEGAFNYTSPSTGVLSNDNYSYPTYLHKLTNIEIDNYGRGGYTAPEFATAYASHDWTGYDFAIIMFGINDVLEGVSPADSMTGITTIINSVKSYNNNIKIFLSTITPAYTDGNNLYDEENEAIRTLAASLPNVYLIDLNEISICHKDTPYVQGHLTALGYNQTAREFMSGISNVIHNNLSDFKNVQFIGTNYDYSA